MTNEILVDIFVFLERAVLDAVKLTSRQFGAIVDKHLSIHCLRKLRIGIRNDFQADNMLPFRSLLPGPGVYIPKDLRQTTFQRHRPQRVLPWHDVGSPWIRQRQDVPL